MKQHITKKQWGELSEENKRLITNRNPDNLHGYMDVHIGQMIEFLGDDWQMIIAKDVENLELCDALWEACKYKLNV